MSADIHERDLCIGGCRQHVLFPQGQVVGEDLVPLLCDVARQHTDSLDLIVQVCLGTLPLLRQKTASLKSACAAVSMGNMDD